MSENKHGCQTDSPRGGTNITIIIVTALPGIRAANCLLIPKAIISYCLYVYIPTSLWMSSGGLGVLIYHFSTAKMSLLAISPENAADTSQYRGLFSLWSNMNALCSSERSHLLNMGRSPHFEVCVGVWMLVFSHWVNVLSVVLSYKNTCVMTSSPLFLLGCHDVNDGYNAAKTLRLCSFMFFRLFLFFCFFQLGQGVVYPLFMSTLVIQRKAI